MTMTRRSWAAWCALSLGERQQPCPSPSRALGVLKLPCRQKTMLGARGSHKFCAVSRRAELTQAQGIGVMDGPSGCC